MTKPSLLEPSFADLLQSIESANDLSAKTKTHWCCSVRQMVVAIDKPGGLIPARWTAVRSIVFASPETG
jgi:hypothetical protein